MVVSSTKTLIFSLLLGAYYAGVIGFGTIGFGLGATIGNILFFASIFFLLREQKKPLTTLQYFFAGCGIALSFFTVLTTNPLLVTLNHAVMACIFSLLLLTYHLPKMPTTATSYARDLLRYGFTGFLQAFFGIFSLKIFSFIKLPTVLRLKIPKDIRVGVLVSLPILVIFHLLFTQINAEYAEFVTKALQELWRIIRLIIDIDFLWFLFKAWISSYVIYTFLTVHPPETNAAKKKLDAELRMFFVILALTAGLFGLFSFFQSKLLMMDMAALAFKTLSIYTQQGFWELVGVAVLGYCLSLWIIGKIHKDTVHARSLRHLLTLFSAELILITVFSYHKLFWLQYLFGLKDQRMMATAGVVLITLTCVLFIGRIWKKVSSSQIFVTQLIGLFFITLFLNAINMDAFVTRTYPISYYVHGIKHKDYSYLLGNSYDNYPAWIPLMKEVMTTNPPQPTEYYWGWYQPLCTSTKRYDVHRLEERVHVTTYLTDHITSLEWYGKLQWKMPLTALSRFNWREYQAYQTVKSNRQTVDEFLLFVTHYCGAEIQSKK